jgi:hypothetical protein
MHEEPASIQMASLPGRDHSTPLDDSFSDMPNYASVDIQVSVRKGINYILIGWCYDTQSQASQPHYHGGT